MNFFKKFTNTNKEKIDMEENIDIPLDKSLNINKEIINKVFQNCEDIAYRDIKIHFIDDTIKILLINVINLVNPNDIKENIIKPLNDFGLHNRKEKLKKNELDIETIKEVISTNSVQKTSNFKEVIQGILSGKTFLVLDNSEIGLLLSSENDKTRNIEESTVESVIRGPRDSFIENIDTNIGLIRYRIKSSSLKVKYLTLGSESNTTVSIIYMQNIVNKQFLSEVIKKLKEMKVDGVFESGYIEQYLEESPYSPFPQIQITERPDKVCGNLMEGKIIILVDGSPVALILPISFFQLFQSSEDYFERIPFGNFARFLRFIGFIIATSLPSIYVALISFHQEMLPMNLVVDLSRTRGEIPFPPVIEALLMEITIELLREASGRLPGTVGQTIGIVGAIVIGEAAIQARLASPAMIIVVAITAIGSYILPHYSTSYALRIIRFPIILMAATFGAFGIIIAWTWIVIHLCSLESFGYPYLSPLSPLNDGIKRDAFIRAGFWNLKNRPKTASKKNRI